MGKKAKDHRRRVAKRNEEINVIKKKMQKAKQEFLMQVIEKEKAAGKFDNNPNGSTLIDIGQGPQI